MFEGLTPEGAGGNPSEVLDSMISKDGNIDLKTNLPNMDGIKNMIYLHVLNRMIQNPEELPYISVEKVLNKRYKFYMASYQGWRSTQIIEGIKQIMQQVIAAGSNAIESITAKK